MLCAVGMRSGVRMVSSGVSSAGSLSYSFSGAGWLTPYHLGVIHALKEFNLISSKSIVAGSSGGAIAAVIVSTNVSELDALEAFKISVHDSKPMKNIDSNLRKMLSEMLPPDAYLRCSHTCHLTITKVSPLQKTPFLISEFSSNSDLIDCVATSCFIPLYCAPKTFTIFRGEKSIDGGIFAFLPPIGDITVNPLPQVGKYMFNPRRSVIHPLLVPEYSVPLKTMIRWSLFPPSEAVLDDLFRLGDRSARLWAATIADHEGTSRMSEFKNDV
jgi:hypothetical protein